MRWRFALYGTLLAASAIGCASPNVGYDYDRSADFSRYHTYAWILRAQEATGDRRLDSSLVDVFVEAKVFERAGVLRT